jgi:hypothetical protein
VYTAAGLSGRKHLAPLELSEIAPFQDEWSILLECASPVSSAPRFTELARSADWSRLLILAEEHGVLGHLAKRLRELGEDLVPAAIRGKLLDLHRARVFLTLRMTAEMFRLFELFAAQGIPALAVKGPVLAMQAYGDPAIRSYGDLDFLVRQRDIRRATESLQDFGYQATVNLRDIDAGNIPGQYLFSKPGANLLVELHNDFTLRYFPRRLPLDQFFERHTLIRLDDHESPALAIEDQLIYICVHGATHFWDRLSWIADVAALVSRQAGVDWQLATNTAKEVGAECMLHSGLRLAADLLHARLPAKVLAVMQGDVGAAKLAAYALKCLIADRKTSPSLFERVAFRLRMPGSRIAAPAYLLRLIFSPTEEDWLADGGIKQNRLFDAFRRPFRLARKYGRMGKS